MPKMTVDPNYCKGCGLCIIACPRKIIRLSENINAKGYNYAECIEQEKCTACKLYCVRIDSGKNSQIHKMLYHFLGGKFLCHS